MLRAVSGSASGSSGTVNSGTQNQIAYYPATGSAVSGDPNFTDASLILTYGPNGTTNPSFQVDASAASAVTGLKITARAASSGVQLAVLSTAASENLSIQGKGSTCSISLAPNGSGRLIVMDYTTTVNTVANSNAGTIRFGFTGAADTGLTASTEAPSTYFNIGQTRQHATGTITLQRDFRITPTTHSFVGASVITDVSSFGVDSPPVAGTNATFTRAWSAMFNGPVQEQRLVQINTSVSASPNLIPVIASNIRYSNFGSSAENYHTLPSASVGLYYKFIVENANGIRVVAQSGQTIRVNAALSTAGGYIESTTIGTVVGLVATSTTTWVAEDLIGTWTAG